MMSHDNMTIVAEHDSQSETNGIEPTVQHSKFNLNQVEEKENQVDNALFDFPLPTPNPIENLEEYMEEGSNEERKIEEIPKIRQPESDFKMIDELLKSTQTYTMKDVINEIKSVTAKAQNKGVNIRTEEMDFENNYQIIINIEKNK